MKTKAQKKQQVELGQQELGKSETVVITDFTGLSANDLNAFRRAVRGIGGKMVVVKKRLLKLVLKDQGLDFEPKDFAGQTGVVFSPKDMVETAGAVHKFGKPFALKNLFKISGGFEVKEKKFVDAETVKRYGELPTREVLLGQLAFMLTVPIKKVLFVLNEKAKKVV
jgi:large subunit ribosomal protein L10